MTLAAPQSVDDALRSAANLARRGEPSQLADALAIVQGVLSIEPGNRRALRMAGRLLFDTRQYRDAVAHLERALGLTPDSPALLQDLGQARMHGGHLEAALWCFERAIELGLDNAALAVLRGLALRTLGRTHEAEASFERALVLDPSNATARFNLACGKLQRGDFSRGWPGYEARWDLPAEGPAREPGAHFYPPWRGESLEGRRVLVAFEQGIGDCLQFVRYVPLLVERGASVYLLPRAGLEQLLRDSFPEVWHVANGDTLPVIDFHAYVMSLPGAFATTVDTVPAGVPYLRTSDALRVRWGALLGPATGLRVGLAWRGSPTHPWDALRSMKPEDLRPLASVAGVQFVSLQQEMTDEERREFANWPNFVSFGDSFRDMAETAALVANLDVVISVDTSIAHLAGALAKPTWILLHATPEWRWLLDRTDTPWYPSARLFLQSVTGRWESVVRSVAIALAARLPSSR